MGEELKVCLDCTRWWGGPLPLFGHGGRRQALCSAYVLSPGAHARPLLGGVKALSLCRCPSEYERHGAHQRVLLGALQEVRHG